MSDECVSLWCVRPGQVKCQLVRSDTFAEWRMDGKSRFARCVYNFAKFVRMNQLRFV